MDEVYNRRWTAEEDQYIAEHYKSDSVEDIAKHLNRSVKAVYMRAFRKKKKSSHAWSEEEIEYLEEHYGKKSNLLIAKKLGRSVQAVEKKAARRMLGRKDTADGLITFHALYTLLRGTAPCRKTKEYLKRHGLRTYTYRLYNGILCESELVNIDEFWKWAEQHRGIVSFAKLEENSLGLEPKWVKEQRKQEWLEISERRWAGTEA